MSALVCLSASPSRPGNLGKQEGCHNTWGHIEFLRRSEDTTLASLVLLAVALPSLMTLSSPFDLF